MDDEILASRQRVSRRRLMAVGGSIGLGTLLAACGSDGSSGGTAEVATPTGTATVQPTTAASGSSSDKLTALLDEASRCTLAVEETQGPYWFDVDAIRSDITEGRPGTQLRLGLRVIDAGNCDENGTPAVIRDAVVELWHCDAGGSYSGFTGDAAGPPGGNGGGEVSRGSYSEGVEQATPTDDSTFLRGAQVTNEDGIARFTTIYPGWYSGRTVHIHLKVHIDKKNVLTTQLYFDDALSDEVFATEPYSGRGDRDVRNDADGIYDAAGVLKIQADADRDGYLGGINLAINT